MSASFRSDILDYTVTIHRETDSAVLVSEEGGHIANAVWLPKSQIEIEGPTFGPRTYQIQIPQWLAEEKGLV